VQLILGLGKIKTWVNRALRSIFKRDYQGGIEPSIFEAEAASIVEAVETGVSIAYNSPHFEFSMKLRESGLWFAARKSYAQASDLAALLDNGKRSKRTWAEFRKLAAPITGQYNQTWLRTEYDTAVRSARIASQWKDMERTADRFPNVEYLHTRSSNPRENHLQYVGIIRPLNDVFWDTHTPPLGWNCKCDVRSTDVKATAIPGNLPVAPPGLRNNPARSGSLFSEDHPYAVNARKVEERLRQEFRQEITRMGLHYKVQTPDGNIVLVHPGVDKNEMAANIRAAVRVADHSGQRMNVKVRPLKHEDGKKQPDLIVNEELADLKTLDKPDNIAGAIQKQIQSAAKQKAPVVVHDFGEYNVKRQEIKDAFRAALAQNKPDGSPYNSSIERLIILHKTGNIIIERKEVLNWTFLEKLDKYP
jgi:hypothetical protein